MFSPVLNLCSACRWLYTGCPRSEGHYFGI